MSQRYIWRCPASTVRSLYERNVGERHLDIGPGTGYYVSRAPVPENGVVHLLDLNEVPLRRAAGRVKKRETRIHIADALGEFPLEDASLDSVGCSMVMHCIPGDMATKSAMFDEVARVLRPGGRFFGATILSDGVDNSRAARKVLDVYNNSFDNAFHNTKDSFADLQRELENRFTDVDVRCCGSAGVWEVSAK
nr:class I SAM-dependent methyltransferase [Haloactinospora alba]